MITRKPESTWWLAALSLPLIVVATGIIWSSLKYADPVQELLPSAETPLRLGAFSGAFIAFVCAALSVMKKESKCGFTLITVVPAAICLLAFWRVLIA